MIYLYIQQRVEDFARWKESFDIAFAARQASGATGETLLLRNIDDPMEIIVVMRWRDRRGARLFRQSVSLQMSLKTMALVGAPHISLLKDSAS